MQVTAKMDYAVRAMIQLAATTEERLSRDAIAEAQDIPARYLEEILSRLRQGGLVSATRGAGGGFALARSARQITVADIWRVVDGPLTLVQGERPESVDYDPPAQHLRSLWVGLRASVRSVMETVTLDHLVTGRLPKQLQRHLDQRDAWVAR